tara:strand:+ start:3392 stop:3661 length:270 start_codon:yes stop_codon:yes gene_type:complete
MNNQQELNSGLLVMGMSNTVFFGEGVVHEIVLVDLSTGKDFSMPISEEQAGFLVNILNEEQVEEEPANEVKPNAAEKSAWSEAEVTPQL